MRCSGHVPPIGPREDAGGNLGTQASPEELDEVAGEREVQASLLRLLPQANGPRGDG